MIKFFTERLNREDRGFTLIELMVVVLIIAILIAIAIPTFLGARRRAQDRAAQSSLRNTVTAAKAEFTDRETYENATAERLARGEPSLVYLEDDGAGGDQPLTASTDPLQVVVDPARGDDPNVFLATAFSKAGKCWFVQDTAGDEGATNLGTRWAVVTGVDEADGCDETGAPAQNDTDNWHREPGEADSDPFEAA